VPAACRSSRELRPSFDPPSPEVRATVLDYVDGDAFDALFESSLVNQDPVIIVRTQNEKPDWQGRLNAWIAAWNQGGKVERRVVRGQIPVPSINADTLREFRLLAGAVVDHAEQLAKAGASWWHEDRVRSRRVALLKPYNLRFHMAEDNRIHLIFFNGSYAAQYKEFMSSLTQDEEEDWSRVFACSACKMIRDKPPPGMPPAE
jgi:hypothetical protein